MKPHRLTFGGIGPYAQRTEVDFDVLGTMGLYLIVGPTGSGKTTIFDAMTYALFGTTASSRESMFVSDLSSRVDPIVEFEFSHQGRHFIAHREPAKEQGKPATSNKQWLREVDISGHEVRTVTGAREMNAQVKELLGLEAEQFMKVVLLPQGKFQEFLMSPSSERRPLLQKIFGTQIYYWIAERTKSKATELENAARDASIQLDSERGTARSVVESLGDELRAILPDPDEDLPGVISELETLATDRELTVTKASNELQDAQDSVTRATSDAERFDADVELKELSKEHEAEVEAVEAAKVSLAASQKAERVIQADNKRQGLRSTSQVARAREDGLRADLNRTLKSLRLDERTTEALFSAVPSASPAALLQEASSLQQRVEKVLEDAGEVERLSQEVKTAEKLEVKASKAIKSLESSVTKTTKDLTTAKKKLKDCNEASKKLPALETKIGKWDELHEQGDVDGTVAELVAAQETMDKAARAFENAEDKLETARRNRTRHLAGELAATLAKGDACPVCGSLEHPQKATKSTDVDIDKLESTRDEAQGIKTEAESAVTIWQGAVEAAKKAQSKLPTAAEEKKIRKQFDDLSELVDDLDGYSDLVEELEGELVDLREQIGSLKVEMREHHTKVEQFRKQISVLEPKSNELGDLKAVEKAVAVLSTAEQIIRDLDESATQAESASAAAETADRQVADVLKTEKFATVDEARGAFLTDEDSQRLDLLIAAAETRDRRIVHLRGAIGSNAVPKERPDIDRLTLIRVEAQRAFSQAQDAATTVSNAVMHLKAVQKTIKKLGPRVAESQEEALRARQIATVMANGSGAGADRLMALEEWVQRALFDEVCDVATSQLLMLSNNRYILTLDSENAKTRRRAGGLELYVMDSQSGKRRSVQTLSGGEQFLTSLALALALAEVVERHAGGMELSALFIDEGFGSLDADTLEAAMDVLMKLQDTGRTIGVITHVEAMQQQLPVGIRIEKSTKTGSTLRVVANA